MRIKLFILFLYLFIFLILEINNQCNKETPIRKKSDNNCYNIYCTEIEFQNGDCIIDNSIIKTQWLNKLFYLGDNIINILTVIEMPNNNIFFLSSKWEYEADYLYIYRLKSSGEINYNENNNNFKSLLISSFSISEFIYSTEINAVGLIIDNNEYIFICQFLDIECQLIEFENDKIFNEYLTTFLNFVEGIYDYSIFFTILNLNQNNNILLSFVYENTLSLSIINTKNDEEISYDIIMIYIYKL